MRKSVKRSDPRVCKSVYFISFIVQQSTSTGNTLPSNTQICFKKEQKADKLNSFVSLVFILDTFFILNQLGYCMAGAIMICTMIYGPDIPSSETQLTFNFLSIIIECLSHSLNFFCYIKFSSLMRQEF